LALCQVTFPLRKTPYGAWAARESIERRSEMMRSGTNIRSLSSWVVPLSDEGRRQAHRRGPWLQQAAKALFTPTNNGLLNNRIYPRFVREARASDLARAVEKHTWVIRKAYLQTTDLLIADVVASLTVK
jgi:hypothetical protein